MGTLQTGRRDNKFQSQFPWRSLGFGILVLIASGYGLFADKLSVFATQTGINTIRLVPDHLYDVDFIDSRTGYASGYYGTLLKTSNGGEHWQSLNSGVDELLRRVNAVDASHIWAVGHRGSILHTSNGGNSWQTQYQLPGKYLRDLSFTNKNIGWVVGHEASILKTEDGGKSWQPQQLAGYKGRDLPRLNAVLALDSQRAIVTGEFGVLAITENGGNHWQLLKTPRKTTMTALASTDTYIVAIGLDGTAWQFPFSQEPEITKLDTNTKEHLFDLTLNADGKGIAVGRSVLLAINGQTLTTLNANTNVELSYNWFHGIDALPNGEYIAVGRRGSIIKSSEDLRFQQLARLGSEDSVSPTNFNQAGEQ